MKRNFGRLAGMVIVAIACVVRGADAPATQPALEPIRYERTGGFAGTHDVVEITKDGVAAVQGKLLKSGKGQLTADQIAKLAPLFANWKDLKASYPAPVGSADDFVIKIRYGTQEVIASDINQALPESFKAAQNAIEAIARDVGGK